MKQLAVLFIIAVIGGLKCNAESLVSLTEDNFDEVVDGSKHVFVKFFAPWCGHCKKLAPTWEQLADAFKDEPEVVIAELDATEHPTTAHKYEVKGYPTLIYFSKTSNEKKTYKGNRKIDALVKFVNERAGTARNPDGSTDRKLGIVEEVETLITGYKCGEAAGADCVSQLAKEVAATTDSVKAETDPKFLAYYSKSLSKIAQKGLEFVGSEIVRSPKKGSEEC